MFDLASTLLIAGIACLILILSLGLFAAVKFIGATKNQAEKGVASGQKNRGFLYTLHTAIFGDTTPVQPTRTRIGFLGMQDPPTPHYSLQEIEEQNLICLGARVDNGLAEYIDMTDFFRHALTFGITGIGKTEYFISTYLLKFIMYFQNSSTIILDAMDGVIERAIHLARRVGRPVWVIPDNGMNMLMCSPDPYIVAERFAAAYVQYASASGDGKYFVEVSESWLLSVIPLHIKVYGSMTLRELRSLASEKDARRWLVEDAEELDPNMDELQDYLSGYSTRSVKAEDLTHHLYGLANYLKKITSGKYGWMLCQKDAPSLDELVNDPRRPLIIFRVGDYEGSVKHTLGILTISMISSFIMNRNPHTSHHPVLCYIDEGGLLTQTSSKITPQNIASILATARKRLCGFILGMQNLDQIPHEIRSAFTGNCATKIIHADAPAENAATFAEWIGYAEYLETNPSESREDGKVRVQISSQTKTDYIIHPTTISSMSRDEVIVLKPHAAAKRTPLHLKKPRLILKDVEEYVEPKVPTTAPKTVWQERGYYKTRMEPRQNNSNRNHTKLTGKDIADEAERLLRDYRNNSQNGNNPPHNQRKSQGENRPPKKRQGQKDDKANPEEEL